MKREDLKGITARACPTACTPDHCVISTVGICKHPLLQGDAGCGPITIANREEALKVIKINAVEGGEPPASAPAAAPKKPAQRRKKARKPRTAKTPPAPSTEAGA